MDTEKPIAKGLRTDEDHNEYASTAATIKANVAELASRIRESGQQQLVLFTGAGISTSARLPDYRGPNGVWTLREKGIDPVFEVSFQDAKPTVAHTVAAQLEKIGFARGTVSTNVDNLHLRAGSVAVAELHGNLFDERCTGCNKTFHRSFDVTAPRGCQPDHGTGHKCEDCGGELRDTIVHFGECLNETSVKQASEMVIGAKTALVLGTSLRVRPASDFPTMAEKMFIVNKQKTPHDVRAVVTHCDVDLFMTLLAKQLDLKVALEEPEAVWEQRCDEASLQNEAKEKEAKEKQKVASRKALEALVTPQLKQYRPQQKGEIANEKGAENKDVSPAAQQPLMIRNCSDCSFCITSNTVVKLVLLECQNISLIVAGRILTGVLEIINCSGTKVAVVKTLPTIQIDNSRDVVIGFVAPNLSGSVVASANCSVSIAPRKDLPPENLVFSGVQEGDYWQGMTQFVTRIREDCSLLTELVVREGGGYATTQREKDAADAKDARAEAALLKYLGIMIK